MVRAKHVWFGVGVGALTILAVAYLSLRPAQYDFVKRFNGQALGPPKITDKGMRDQAFGFRTDQPTVEAEMVRELTAKGWRKRYPSKGFMLVRNPGEIVILYDNTGQEGFEYPTHVAIEEQAPWLHRQWLSIRERF